MLLAFRTTVLCQKYFEHTGRLTPSVHVMSCDSIVSRPGTRLVTRCHCTPAATGLSLHAIPSIKPFKNKHSFAFLTLNVKDCIQERAKNGCSKVNKEIKSSGSLLLSAFCTYLASLHGKAKLGFYFEWHKTESIQVLGYLWQIQCWAVISYSSYTSVIVHIFW